MIQELWNGVLDLMSKLVIPDWGSLVALIPIALLVFVALWLARTAFRFATAGPTRRVHRLTPVPPAGVHAPGPSLAPFVAAVGAFALFWGLVVGGAAILLGLVALVAGLLYWGREGLRDYDHLAQAEPEASAIRQPQVPVVHGEPPPGVHMIGPSFRPLLASMAVAVLFFGLVFPGWLLLVGLLFVIVTLIGWLVDARKEFLETVEADRTGHLEPLPPPTWPKPVLAVFSVLVVAALVVDAGILPPRTQTAGGPGASPPPGGSPPPSGPGGPGGSPPAADVTIIAQQVAFTTPTVTAPADKPFTIAFDNRDPSVPHDVDIHDAQGGTAFDGAIVQGPKVEIYQVPALAAGSYPFSCSVHPSMTGTMTVE
ncbi:MAG TPA: cytochrome c oxidase subunit 4 [Candidatus Limnocylindrales bacterium]